MNQFTCQVGFVYYCYHGNVIICTEDDTLSWLSEEESSPESDTSAPPPSKTARKLQVTTAASTSVAASLKVPSKKEGNGPTPCKESKSPVTVKQLVQKPYRTIITKPQVTAKEVTYSAVTPSSLLVRIPLPIVKQQQQQPVATPTVIAAKKTLGSGSSSLSSSDLSDSESDTNPPAIVNNATVTTETVRKTILRVPHTANLTTIKTTIVTKQPSSTTTATTEAVAVTKATTISQVMSKPTLTIPSQQILLKPLTGKNATSNISQRLANIYSPTQVKAFQLTKTVTSPKTSTGSTLPFAAFTWSNRTTTSNTTSVDTSTNNSGFTLLSPSNASKLQLPFTSLTSNQTGAFRVIAQTATVNTTNSDTVQESTTQQ